MSTLSRSFLLPQAQQAQIIRSNQRDIFHVASLREQTDAVLRSWLGTRWLSRWDKEIDLAVKLCYYGLTTGRALQTLGEEYTDIWQYTPSKHRLPLSPQRRLAFIFFSLFPAYALGRYGQSHTLTQRHPRLATLLQKLPTLIEVVTEVNLAVFYLRGTYYNVLKRLLGIRYASSIPENPHIRPPSYSLLGIMIGIRLLHRLITLVRTQVSQPNGTLPTAGGTAKASSSSNSGLNHFYLDDRPVSAILDSMPSEDDPPKPAEDDEGTALDVTSIPEAIRASRTCTLCLEERTDTTSTECGHLFCWNCVVSWGREKAECPLCRQLLTIDKLLPIYNL